MTNALKAASSVELSGRSIRDAAQKSAILEEIAHLSQAEALELARFLNACRSELNAHHLTREKQTGTGSDPLGRWAAQSQIFVVDCVPAILTQLRKHHSRADRVSLLDVGSGTGAGTSLLATLLSSDMLWCPVQVSGIDLFPHRLLCAENNFANFEYKIGDIFEHGQIYDYVFCSHVLEHVPEPAPFLKRLTELARYNVFVYTPYDERERIAGHLNTITKATFDGFDVEHIEIKKSAGWRWGKPNTDMCILAVLAGTAGRTLSTQSQSTAGSRAKAAMRKVLAFGRN